MPLIAVASIALVALFGLAVDGGSLMMHRTQLQKVADAAALGLVINCPTNTTDDSCKNDTSPNTGAIVSAVNPSEAGFSIATLHPRDSNFPDPSTQSYCS